MIEQDNKPQEQSKEVVVEAAKEMIGEAVQADPATLDSAIKDGYAFSKIHYKDGEETKEGYMVNFWNGTKFVPLDEAHAQFMFQATKFYNKFIEFLIFTVQSISDNSTNKVLIEIKTRAKALVTQIVSPKITGKK